MEMKLKAEWWKLVKQVMVLTISALCLVGMTGCGGDDDDGDGDWVGTWSMYQVSGETWQLIVTVDGESETQTLTMPEDGGLSELDDGYYDLGYGFTMTINGYSIVLEMSDADFGTLTLTGTISSDYKSVEGDIYFK
jgi:hypothetical protein